eukprot:14510524-Heterocapsa_arctica.AAC.1
MLGNAVLDSQSRAAKMHVQKVRGVLVGGYSIDTREHQPTFTRVVLLRELLKVEGDLPSFLKDCATTGVCLGGVFGRHLQPSVFVLD